MDKVKRVNNNIKEKARKVKLLILDVDGVLTEGRIVYDSRGRDIKSFNVKDGLGVSLLSKQGLSVIILTARESRMVNKRARDMGVKQVYSGYPKEDFLPGILKKYNVSPDEVCYIGDDLIDIETAKRVGFSVAVKDACNELKEVVDMITQKEGGKGAVRELVELIMKEQGLWRW
jgi:3-deoxy-D-manno-octulosonate 8-phosphate phosphatase (KDO 8-P phosphatase)